MAGTIWFRFVSYVPGVYDGLILCTWLEFQYFGQGRVKNIKGWLWPAVMVSIIQVSFFLLTPITLHNHG